MAVPTQDGWPSLADWAQARNPDGSIAAVVDILSERNDALKRVPWMMGNLETGHRITHTANTLPSAGWRQLNKGTPRTKTDHEQFDESCGRLEDNSEVDTALADLNGDSKGYRALIDSGKIEGIGQQFAQGLFYESVSTNPERIHGLAPRYNSTSSGTAKDYVLAGTNAGTDCHSIWLIAWELDKIFGIFPKGSQAGLQVTDKGEQRVEDSDGNPYYAYCTNIVWNVGIAVKDYRYAVRFQWDPDDAEMADTDKGVYLKMQEMLNTVYRQTPSMCFHMNRTSKTKLDAQLLNNDANPLQYLSPQGMSGKQIPHFMGVPILIDDALVAETAIS